jgi:hypothetical protein|tara:strand:- start:157 stop:357 length:201 start_codon:yes stop_codon:yes gene_type:complete
MKNAWFYFHCVLAIIILVKDHNGTLEESLNKFEEKIGIYTPPDTTKTEAFTLEIEDESSTGLERNE